MTSQLDQALGAPEIYWLRIAESKKNGPAQISSRAYLVNGGSGVTFWELNEVKDNADL